MTFFNMDDLFSLMKSAKEFHQCKKKWNEFNFAWVLYVKKIITEDMLPSPEEFSFIKKETEVTVTNKIINKGTGAGGFRTNLNGLKFEEDTCFLKSSLQITRLPLTITNSWSKFITKPNTKNGFYG